MTPVYNPGDNIQSLSPKGSAANLAKAKLAIDIAVEKQASDILLLDVQELTPLTDYVIILTADNFRQLNGLSEDIRETLKSRNIDLHHLEGSPDSGWMLMDFTDVIIHLFSTEQRSFYDLEQIWNKAKQLIRIQ